MEVSRKVRRVHAEIVHRIAQAGANKKRPEKIGALLLGGSHSAFAGRALWRYVGVRTESANQTCMMRRVVRGVQHKEAVRGARWGTRVVVWASYTGHAHVWRRRRQMSPFPLTWSNCV